MKLELEDGVSVTGGDKYGVRWWVGSTVPESNDPPFWMECENQHPNGWRQFKDGNWAPCRQGDVIAFYDDIKYADGPDFTLTDVRLKTDLPDFIERLLSVTGTCLELAMKENLGWVFSRACVFRIRDRDYAGDEPVYFIRLFFKANGRPKLPWKPWAWIKDTFLEMWNSHDRP